MDCSTLRSKLQPALEGERLSSEARAHLKGCAACDREWLALEQSAVGVAALRLRRPGPGFDARVLAAVAAARRAAPGPWARFALNASFTALALWAAALVRMAPSLGGMELLALVLHPERAFQAAGVRLAEAALAARALIRGAGVAGAPLAELAAPWVPGLLVQAALSAAVAAAVLAALMPQRRKSWKRSPSR